MDNSRNGTCGSGKRTHTLWHKILYTVRQQKTSIWKGITTEKVPVLTENRMVRHTFIMQVDFSQGNDEATEAIEPENLMPKAKT
jgi:hypothetical protein